MTTRPAPTSSSVAASRELLECGPRRELEDGEAGEELDDRREHVELGGTRSIEDERATHADHRQGADTDAERNEHPRQAEQVDERRHDE